MIAESSLMGDPEGRSGDQTAQAFAAQLAANLKALTAAARHPPSGRPDPGPDCGNSVLKARNNQPRMRSDRRAQSPAGRLRLLIRRPTLIR